VGWFENLKYLVGPIDAWYDDNRNEAKRDRDGRDCEQRQRC
jgi:hypothetical protein